MVSRGFTAIVVALSCLGAPTALSQAADGTTKSKKELLVIGAGKAANAHPGNSCLTSPTPPPGSGTRSLCSSVKYDPSPRRLFRASPGSTIVMCAGSPAAKMTVGIIKDSKKGPRQIASSRARRLENSGQCWRARLPRRLRGATSLLIRVDYNRTDFVRFIAGISVRN